MEGTSQMIDDEALSMTDRYFLHVRADGTEERYLKRPPPDVPVLDVRIVERGDGWVLEETQLCGFIDRRGIFEGSWGKLIHPVPRGEGWDIVDKYDRLTTWRRRREEGG